MIKPVFRIDSVRKFKDFNKYFFILQESKIFFNGLKTGDFSKLKGNVKKIKK